MANIPTPRSYAQTLGDMVDVYLSKLGFRGLKVGGPLLSLFETATQSDVRSSSDFFALLASVSLKNARGVALDRIAADEGLERIKAGRAVTALTFSDTSFTKLVSRIYQGAAAPVAGSASVNIVDGSSFPASGKIYIGRDTTNVEGPVSYSAITQSADGSFWILTLVGTTTKFHNLAETVTLAQGGDRTVSAGQVVTTPQNTAASTISFSTVDTVTIPDGETTIENVRAVAQQAGVAGNVPFNALTALTPSPFTGAAVTNPLPVSNGANVEGDDALRERVRAIRASRTKGTVLALTSGVLGLTATGASSTIASASLVVSKGEPSTLYIDDGTGYEETASALAFETVVDSASGGEQRLQLTGGSPLTKAFARTSTTAPFLLVDGTVLSVKIGGVLSQIVFTESQFRSIGSATSYECVAAINAAYELPFAARTVSNGQGFAIFAKSDTNEDIQVVAPTSGVNANQFFGFPVNRIDTLRLFRNDKLLFKDGLAASVFTTDHGSWNANIQAGDTFIYTVDGTVQVTWALSNQDFVAAGTGYTQVAANNSLDAWAAVFNLRCPGITATVAGNVLQISSNLGADSRASIVVDPSSTLVSNRSMFVPTALAATGQTSDYSLDRNLAQIKLAEPLAEGDRLTAATPNTRAYVESSSFSTVTVPASQTANFWFVVDGGASVIGTGISAQTTLTISSAAITGGVNSVPVYRVTVAAAAGTFSSVAAGDWLIMWDPALASFAGVWRIADKSGDSGSLFVESTTSFTLSAAPVNSGVVVVRSAVMPQQMSLAAGIYSPDSFVSSCNLVGATPTVFRTSQIHITTDTFGLSGDVSLVAADTNAQLFPFVVGGNSNETSHVGYVESATADSSTTPTFDTALLDSAVGTSLVFSTTSTASFRRGGRVVWLRPSPSGTPARDNTNRGSHTVITNTGGTTTATVASLASSAVAQSRLYSAAHLAISPDDTLSMVLDGNLFSKSYTTPLARTVKPTSTFPTWTGNSVVVTDTDGTSLTKAFPNFDFTDFILHLRAKTITSPPSDPDTATHAVVWRCARYGREGEKYRLSYTNPAAPNSGFAVTATPGDLIDVSVQLPSGAARVVTLAPRLAFNSTDNNASARTVTYFSGVRALAAFTVSGGVVTSVACTMTGMPAAVANHLFANGDLVMISGGPSLPNGTATVSGVTTTTFTLTYATPPALGASGTDTVNVTSISNLNAITPPSLTALVVGDIVTVGAATKLASTGVLTGRLSAVDPNGNYFQVSTRALGSTVNSAYAEIVSSSNVQAYPLDTTQTNTTAAAPNLASRVNALNNPFVIAAIPVYSRFNIPQSGQPVTISTFDDFVVNGVGDGNGYVLTNGVRYVSGSSIVNGQYQMTIAVGTLGSTPGLWTTDADWTNERAKLVPVGAASLARYLSAPAVTGLSTSGEVKASSQAGKLQIATGQLGSAGSVRIVGGSANSVLAPVVGYALPTSTGCYVQARSLDALGLNGGHWVSVQALQTVPKALSWGLTTQVQLTAGAPQQTAMTVSVSGRIAQYAGTLTSGYVGNKWQIEKHGRYTCFFWVDAGTPATFASVKEGDFVRLRTDSTHVGTASAANMGLFRVVRVNYHTSSGGTDPSRFMFWIENPAVIEEVSTTGLVEFFDADSILPGDTININTDALGLANEGSWTVLELGAINGAGTCVSATISGTMTPVGQVTLGSAAPLIQAFSSIPLKLVKQIGYVAPTGDGSHVYISFTTQDGYQRINSSSGCVISPLDKLAFPTSQATGVDAYNFHTGLVAEANRVCYGIASDPDTYPGIIAAGTQVNISGPLVRRVQVSLLLRVGQGLDRDELAGLVKSAVATVINSTKVGEAIDIAAIVAAARGVEGITAVTVTNPAYGIGNDLIAVQPYEKALVLNLDTDVLVNFIGT